MGLSDHIKRAIGSTPERPTGASGGRLSVSSAASSSDGAGEPVKGRERSASSSFSNLLGGGSDKRKSTEVLQDADDSEVLDESEGNVLLSLISQLRIGMDLTKIALPTFVLEPRSMLERITDFFAHPDLIFTIGKEEDAQERFLAVLAMYMSGWHIKPKGVKKPYNATLGEIFRCSYTYPDGSEGFYVSEQVSHHPPVSAYFYASPQNGVLIYGELRPKSKFLGNSAMTIMDGENRVILMDRPEDGEYQISMPNMYARGIMFGKLILELGDPSVIKNVKTGYSCDMDFKTKGFFSGTYNAVVGKVNGPKGPVGDITGFWSESMDFKDLKSPSARTLFDAHESTTTPKQVAPESEQEPNESRRLWHDLTEAIKSKDMEGATEAKNAVEETQREAARLRGGEANHQMRYFELKGEKYSPLCGISNLPKDRLECTNLIRSWIWPNGAPGAEKKQAAAASSSSPSRPSLPDSEPSKLPQAVPTAPGPPVGPVSPPSSLPPPTSTLTN
ncbi:hypothetical protein BDY24DRAFT_207643 [Mrakia frigida]|uniref:OSBP family protein n=1 Tax=Mrakia frigida TaxID=29902 RepID=UPI003FCBF5F9